MIDQDRLAQAYGSDGIYALQLEVGDACEQGCSYCYMNALPKLRSSLSDGDLLDVLQDASKLGVSAIEWLGGEPLDRPGVFALTDRASELGLRNNIWTGGLPLSETGMAARCADAASGGLVSVHLPTLDPHLYERMHPGRSAGDIDRILRGVEAVLAEGYPPERMLNSTTLTGLQPAGDAIATIDAFEERYGIRTSLNVYHTYLRPGTPPGELARFVPDPKTVRAAHRRWAKQWGGEPFPMNCVDKRYCSATIAVLADGTVTPCATIREGVGSVLEGGLASVFEVFRDELVLKRLKDPANLPDGCASCVIAEDCWGCRSRAYAAGLGMFGKDPRCFRKPARQAEGRAANGR